MEENEPNTDGDAGPGGSNLAKFTGIAFQMIAIIGVFAFVGYKIDKANNHTTQWATAIFALVGVLIAIYVVIKSLKD